MNILHEYLIQHALKLPGTNYHFKCVKVPDTAPYWKAWVLSLNKLTVKVYKGTFFYKNYLSLSLNGKESINWCLKMKPVLIDLIWFSKRK